MSPVKGRYQAKTSHNISPRHSKKATAKAEEEAEAFAAAKAKAPALLATMDRIYTEIGDGKPLNSEQVVVFFMEYQRGVEKVTRPKKKVHEGVEKAFRLRGLKPTVSYTSSSKVVPGDVVTFEEILDMYVHAEAIFLTTEEEVRVQVQAAFQAGHSTLSPLSPLSPGAKAEPEKVVIDYGTREDGVGTLTADVTGEERAFPNHFNRTVTPTPTPLGVRIISSESARSD